MMTVKDVLAAEDYALRHHSGYLGTAAKGNS